MAISYPTNPTVGQTYTYNSVTYTWTGVRWSTNKGGGSGGNGAVANGTIYQNNQLISSSYSIAATQGAQSIGPIAIGNGVVFGIGAGSRYLII